MLLRWDKFVAEKGYSPKPTRATGRKLIDSGHLPGEILGDWPYVDMSQYRGQSQPPPQDIPKLLR